MGSQVQFCRGLYRLPQIISGVHSDVLDAFVCSVPGHGQLIYLHQVDCLGDL